MSDVTAVIPTWNRRDLLVRVLEFVRAQTCPPAQVIVVDNGSTDGSAESAEAAGARVIRMEHNAGFAAAVNRGWDAAATSWITVLNNDVEPEPDWLERLLEAATRRNASFAAGKLLTYDGARIDGTFDLVARSGCAWRVGSGSSDGPVWNEERDIACASFTAVLLRRDLSLRVGQLDERFGSYLEDVDFGLRCAVVGCTGVYAPAAVARHRGSATLGAWSQETVRLIARNQVLLAAKHLPLRCLWHIVAGQLLWGVLAARHGAARAYLRGKVSALRMWRPLRRDYREPAGLTELLAANERDIEQLQRATGFDWYWRAYFTLT